MTRPRPELLLSQRDAAVLTECAAMLGDLESIEVRLTRGEAQEPIARCLAATDLVARARALWEREDHLRVKGLPERGDGASAVLLAAYLFGELKTYRGGKVVKHFRMSPWTRALSHTLAEGHFHTDLNTAERPPAATVIQCLEPDPGGPQRGQLRIARLVDLIAALEKPGRERAKAFLLTEVVEMVNETSTGCWTGRMVESGKIRFHPATLRAAQARAGRNPPDLEECLFAIHEAALEVAFAYPLEVGEAVILSNARTLHQRAASSVRFRAFPREFDARKVAVLHAINEWA